MGNVKGKDSQLELGVDLGITEVLADICKEDLHLLGFPTQQLRVQTHSETFQSVLDLYQVPGSNGFLQFVSLFY